MRIPLILILFFFLNECAGQVKVRGYYRKDGTYVQPHYRSNPDGNPYNNWSYPGNVNPYTGKVAPGNPATYLDNYYNRNSTYSPPSYNSTSTYTAPTTSSTYSTSNTYYVTSQQLNIRTGPSTSNAVLTTLNYNDNVTLISSSGYPWYRVKVTYYDNNSYNYKTSYGYAHASYLSERNPTYTSSETSYANSYNYTQHDDLDRWLTDSRSKSTLSQAEINALLDELKTKVDYNSNYSNIGEYYVQSDQLNVRNGPSTEFTVLTTLNYMDNVVVVSTSSYPWYQVRVTYFDSGQSVYRTGYGYVHSSYISTVSASSSIGQSSMAYPIPQYPNYPYGEGKGKISIWTDCTDDGFISVYIDDVYVGQITSYFTTKPDCSSSQTFSIIKPAGRYKITAKGAYRKWEGTMTVYQNECLLQKLSKQ